MPVSSQYPVEADSADIPTFWHTDWQTITLHIITGGMLGARTRYFIDVDII